MYPLNLYWGREALRVKGHPLCGRSSLSGRTVHHSSPCIPCLCRVPSVSGSGRRSFPKDSSTSTLLQIFNSFFNSIWSRTSDLTLLRQHRPLSYRVHVTTLVHLYRLLAGTDGRRLESSRGTSVSTLLRPLHLSSVQYLGTHSPLPTRLRSYTLTSRTRRTVSAETHRSRLVFGLAPVVVRSPLLLPVLGRLHDLYFFSLT